MSKAVIAGISRSRSQCGPTRFQHRGGYVLVMLAVSLATLLGLVGLAVDVGRMYIVKSETQSFVDAAAAQTPET